MKSICAAVLLTVIAVLPRSAHAQVGHLWTFDELWDRAELVAVGEWIATDDTGRHIDHPDLKPWLPMVEMRTTLRVSVVLKQDHSAPSIGVGSVLQLTHYRFDRERWNREYPGVGVVNGGSILQFGNDKGPYLLFLAKNGKGAYEPLSGLTFPTDSIFLLRKLPLPPG